MTDNEILETASFDKSVFHKYIYHSRIFLDFVISDHFKYEIDRHVFRYSDALTNFLKDNKNIIIYLTNNETVSNFQYFNSDILVNIDSFIGFCDNIGYSKKDKSRAKAFFGQHIALDNINISEEEKRTFIQANITEQDLLNRIKTLSPEAQSNILEAIIKIEPVEPSATNPVSSDNFIKLFTKFLSNNNVQTSVFESLPQIQLSTLKELRDFVKNNLDKEETFFQRWLDEDNGKHRKKRCLIFGIEYIDPKREGEIMGRKRFDILATQNRECHILIELKSATAQIFETEVHCNQNDGQTTTYKISKELSRAIPQILGYKKWYQTLNAEKIQELGIVAKKEISECIIVIGTRKKDDLVWVENFKSLTEALSIKIWTYDHLIEKMENTIKNLEENL
ncbi:MAG: Shedu anti-phage system protein SduA domain-containing protein [Ferruginibacter sp.]